MRAPSPEFVAKLFVLVIMGNGLIANYVPQLGVNMGTLCIDVLVLALAAGAIVKECLGKSGGKSVIPAGQKDIFVVFIFVAALTLASYLAVGAYSPGLMSDLRIRFFYFLITPALFVLLTPSSASRVMRFFVNCGVAFSLFAIVQSVFVAQLDSKLLSVEYDGTLALEWSDAGLVLRSNALMGNAIEFGGVCVMLFCTSLAEIFSEDITLPRLVKSLIIAAGCYFSYSRVAFAGLAFVFVALFFMLGRSKGMNKVLQFVVVGFALVIGVFSLLGDSALFARFLGTDAFTQFSNDSHEANIFRAFETIGENFVFGTGLGTQLVSDSRALADGWWLQLACETGVFVFLLYAYFFVKLGFRLLRGYVAGSGFHRVASAVCLVTLCYFVVASIINSSFVGRADLTLFFVLIGCWEACCWGLHERVPHNRTDVMHDA